MDELAVSRMHCPRKLSRYIKALVAFHQGLGEREWGNDDKRGRKNLGGRLPQRSLGSFKEGFRRAAVAA